MRKAVFIFVILAALLLSACGSSTSAPEQNTSTQAGMVNGTPQPGPRFDPSTMSVDTKLAFGILKLEGTDLAVTADQAQELLPLWKAVKSLSSSDTAAQQEIEALYDQIQESLSAEQLKAIEEMLFDQDAINSLMTNLGIEMGPAGGGTADLTDDERATRVAQFQAQGGMPSRRDGSMPGGGGMPAGGDPGMMPQGGMAGGPAASSPMQNTPAARQGMLGFRMNNMFIEPLLNLLQERAGI